MFIESGRHQFLPIYHSRAMTESVLRVAVVVFITPPAFRSVVVLVSLNCEYVGHIMFSLHIDRCTFLGIDISFLLELIQSGVVVCGP